MIINLDVEEAATLLLHMKIMKKSVKKGFKNTYKDNWKEYLAVFEEIIIKVEEKLKEVEEESTFAVIKLDMNDKEHTMLLSFTNYYIHQLNSMYNKQKVIKGKTINQLAALENVMYKARALIC